MRSITIAIVGCGVAGQAAALFLHRAGHRVEIFERFETPRPIGAGLLIQPTGQIVLERLGLIEAALAHGAKVTRMLGHSVKGRVVLDVAYEYYRPGSFGLGLQRGLLFGLLHDAVARDGIAIRTAAEIAEIETAGALRLLDARGQQHGPFDLVLVANGADSALRAKHGAVVRAPRYPYGALWTVRDECGSASELLRQMFDGPKRMAGLLPIGRLPSHPPGTRQVAVFWSLHNDKVEAWRAAGLAAWRRELEGYWPDYVAQLDGLDDCEAFMRAKYRDVVMKTPVAGRILFIGDAAHGTSPQLGQGANLALIDAATLVDSLGDAGAPARDVDAALALYVERRRRHLAFYQWASRWLTPLFQSDRAWLGPVRDIVMGTFGRLPVARGEAAALMAGVSLGPFRRFDLETLRNGHSR